MNINCPLIHQVCKLSTIERCRVILLLLVSHPQVVASDYDAFVKAILPDKDKLPVYTEEIGDTW